MKVGDKVVCVDNVKWNYGDGPRKDFISGIVGVHKKGNRLFLEFKEFPNEAFGSEYFRKVDKKPFTNAVTKELAKKVIENQPETEVEKLKQPC